MERGVDANALGIYMGTTASDAEMYLPINLTPELNVQEAPEVFLVRGAGYYIAAYGKLSVVGTTTITSTREMINAAGFTSR
jgi:hypothetical protein